MGVLLFILAWLFLGFAAVLIFWEFTKRAFSERYFEHHTFKGFFKEDKVLVIYSIVVGPISFIGVFLCIFINRKLLK